MRKALIAIITAAVLFTVGAFAANLTVSTQNVASGEATVGSCASEANVNNWQVGTISGEDDAADWSTTAATVTLTELSTESCAGAVVKLAIFSNDGGGWTETTCSGAAGSTTSYACSGFDLAVRPIDQVAVLVNGDTFDVDTLPA